MNRTVEVKRGPSRRPPLEGRIALVTGGAQGIGRGIAAELLRAGAQVVIGDLLEQQMQETCGQLAAVGPIDWIKLDVSDDDSMDAGVAAIRHKHGPVHILVNNAGIAGAGLFVDQDPQRISKALAIDLRGALYLTRLVLPQMIAAGWGRIVNISSMMAFTGSPGFAVYSAAKAGMLRFSEAIERELRPMRQVRVTAVLPPSVRTRAFEEAKTTQPAMMRWSMVPPVTVEQVAGRTVRGMIAGRKRVYCSTQSYLAFLLERFAPWVMDRVLMYMFRAGARPRLPAPVTGARLPASHA